MKNYVAEIFFFSSMNVDWVRRSIFANSRVHPSYIPLHGVQLSATSVSAIWGCEKTCRISWINYHVLTIYQCAECFWLSQIFLSHLILLHIGSKSNNAFIRTYRPLNDQTVAKIKFNTSDSYFVRHWLVLGGNHFAGTGLSLIGVLHAD